MWQLVAAATGVLMVLVVIGLGVWFSFPNLQDRAQFGDMFGAANALFSGLAFAGVIYALVLQRRELRLQRRELRLTRRELAKQSAVQAEHAAASLKAARISALGAMLSFHVERQMGATNPDYVHKHAQLAESTLKELQKLLSSDAT